MEYLKFISNNPIQESDQNNILALKKYSEYIKKNLKKKYDSDFASLFLLQDKAYLAEVEKIILEKQNLNIKILIVIGIGGSSLGAKAIHEALNGPLYNEINAKIKVYFVDTIDANYVHDILTIVESELIKKTKILINVVTKSGSTTETIVNYTVFLELLKKYHSNDWQKYIVITTGSNSKLDVYARENSITSLNIAQKVGGRYSVFSAVGLFPLGFIGIDIKELLSGALSMKNICLQENIEKNYAMQSALFIYNAYKKGKNIHDTFIFSRNLGSVGAWYRQLVGESLGKKNNLEDKKVEVGITPTISIGPEDLHSVVQLYLAGPRDKCTTFLTVKKRAWQYNIPENNQLKNFVANVQNKSVASVLNAIVDGVKLAYKKDNRFFIEVELPDQKAASIGQFLQFKMLEVIYLGFLMNINPFDQPQVELYKKETRKILANE